jgi:superfamily II DNA or RNA helicase
MRVSAKHPMASVLTELDPLSRAIVELFAVFHHGATRSDVVRALGSLKHRIDGRSPTTPLLEPYVRELVQKGLLIGDSRFQVPPALSHAVLLELARTGRLAATAAAVQHARGNERIDYHVCARELRIALYGGQWDAARKLDEQAPGAIGAIAEPFDPAWAAGLPEDLRGHLLMDRIATASARLAPCREELTLLEAMKAPSDGAHAVLVERLLLEGRLDEAERLVGARASVQSQLHHAWLLAIRGRYPDAVVAYENALKAYLKLVGKRAKLFPSQAGLFFIVALLGTGEAVHRARALALCQAAMQPGVNRYRDAYEVLAEAIEVLEGRRDPQDTHFKSVPWIRVPDTLQVLAVGLAVAWTNLEPARDLLLMLAERARLARDAGLHWLAGQLVAILAKLGVDTSGGSPLLGSDFANAVVRRERWAEQLDALLAIVSTTPGSASAASAPERDLRLVWLLETHGTHVSLTPREQVRSKGTWSKGRPVALKRLYEEARTMDHLTAADRLACAAIEAEVYFDRGYRNTTYVLDDVRALRALAGQPNLLAEVNGELVTVEVRERAPSLRVEQEDGGMLRLVLDPAPRGEETMRATKAGPAVVELIAFEPRHHAIAAALGKLGLKVPRAAEPRLREVLSALSSVASVHAELESPVDGGEAVAADPTPRAVLRARGEGLSIELVVRPLGPTGPSAPPGQGGATFFGALNGRRLHASRDLAEETRRLEALLGKCPTLAAAERTRAGYVVSSREQALEALLELRRETPTEWPDGEAYRVSEPVDVDALSVTLRGARDRFEVDGSLALPGGDPLALDTLLDYLAASPGRVLRLEASDQFVALTEALRQRLDELRALTVPGERRRFHPLFVARVDEALEGARVRADTAWKRQRERLAVVGDEPEVPSTLRAELRPYQVDGYRWLVRLGRMGAGACLADDMGLGKTLQTLALLVQRAPEGPSLVVAPTSVLPSYRDELARFAPTLRPRVYAGEGRAAHLEDLGPFDVLLVSYTVLQQDIEALERIGFAVAVLDEAQAIKNASTLRAKAAFRLQAAQRVVTTGTPIENRLDELFSLFRFLSPGLLGAPSDFAREPPARLKRLVAPFILRRTKTAVARELPPKTEITLRIDPLPEEAALYEALRAQALASVAGVTNAGQRRIHLLAALTKLRRAASNTRLVLPDDRPPSSKLDALGELLDELLPNGHKVLVFSQFVDHLSLVRELFEGRGVRYQYLDGATPMQARKAAIDAFQAGQSDAFLISLKAGGVGLNLTAADYVVHMDPWWNPAVEDQASDRAHRIGQTRPVTVYRMVARGTIEESILELHHKKRDLAAQLLEGADLVGRIGEEELLALIRGD